jgi:hypothetical protein
VLRLQTAILLTTGLLLLRTAGFLVWNASQGTVYPVASCQCTLVSSVVAHHRGAFYWQRVQPQVCRFTPRLAHRPSPCRSAQCSLSSTLSFARQTRRPQSPFRTLRWAKEAGWKLADTYNQAEVSLLSCGLRGNDDGNAKASFADATASSYKCEAYGPRRLVSIVAVNGQPTQGVSANIDTGNDSFLS